MNLERTKAVLAAVGVAALAIAVPGFDKAVAATDTSAAARTVPLVRYFDGRKHWSTTGAKPNAKYREEGRIPILVTQAPGTRAVYSCMSGSAPRDQYLSHFTDCENRVSDTGDNVLLKVEGYLYTQPGPGLKAAYRCYVPHTKSHFFSVKSDCEANPPESPVKAEFVLGYFPA
ncbi:hypothetical protein [Nonomuraea sp. NPDC050643]|uniref:hypothetical protein n=1 Tax=Nonomuraea sp. NPDC050643 TaxID=3155660 RepID=UPI00340E23F4